MIKKTFKWIGFVLLLLAFSCGALITHEWNADKPFIFRAYLDRELIKFAFESPEMLTSLGFLESFGITAHNAELDDARPEKINGEIRDSLLIL